MIASKVKPPLPLLGNRGLVIQRVASDQLPVLLFQVDVTSAAGSWLTQSPISTIATTGANKNRRAALLGFMALSQMRAPLPD